MYIQKTEKLHNKSITNVGCSNNVNGYERLGEISIVYR